MSKQQILIVVGMCFVLLGTVAAGIPHEPKPDSLVDCKGFVQYGTSALTVPVSIDESECRPFEDHMCSTCIRSLENQGCEVVDVDLTNFTNPDHSTWTHAVFVLSCESP